MPVPFVKSYIFDFIIIFEGIRGRQVMRNVPLRSNFLHFEPLLISTTIVLVLEAEPMVFSCVGCQWAARARAHDINEGPEP